MKSGVDEDLPALIRALAESAPAACLLAGGLALAEYGTLRPINDIDVAIAETDAAAFDRVLPLLSYRKIEETRCAARYRHSRSLPDLDLLLVPKERFIKMWSAGFEGGCGLRVIDPGDWKELSRAAQGAGGAAKKAVETLRRPPRNRAEVERDFRRLLREMHAELDPIRYVIYRQEECPLPVNFES